MQICFPLHDVTSGFFGYLFFAIGTIITCLLWQKIIKEYYKLGNNNFVKWFVLSNILVFSSIVFMFRTFPSDTNINLSYNDLIKYITKGKVLITRYSIGIHSILVLSVFPVILKIIKEKSRVNYLRKQSIITALAFSLSFIAVAPPVFNPKFWLELSTQNWSKEWFYLSRELQYKTYYIPIIFYPAPKQQIQTNNTSEIFDGQISDLDFKTLNNKNIHSIILVNNKNFALRNKELKLQLIYFEDDTIFVEPLYPIKEYYKFIIFKLKKGKNIKYFNFVNNNNKKIVDEIPVLRIITKNE